MFGQTISNKHLRTPPGKPFHVIGSRAGDGARWCGAVKAYRLATNDVKAASHDGLVMTWPISYADSCSVFNDVRGEYYGSPVLPEGNEILPLRAFSAPPMKMSLREVLLRERVKAKFAATVTDRPPAAGTHPNSEPGASLATIADPCERGCRTFSFQQPFTTVGRPPNSGNARYLPPPWSSPVKHGNAPTKRAE